MSVRAETADRFRAEWPEIPELADVHVELSQKEIEVDSRVNAIVSQAAIERFPQAPLSHRNVVLTVTFVSALTDVDAGADELDPIISTALDYFDRNYSTTGAQFGLYGDRAAYTIPITIASRIKNQES